MKYRAPFQFSGRMGNLSFYSRKGVPCMRRASGHTRKQIATDPRLRRIALHNVEFGAQSWMAKSLRTALAPLKKFSDGNLHNRFMKIAARITALSDEKFGERPVMLSKMQPILHGFQLVSDADSTFDNFMVTAAKSTPSPTRLSTALKLENITPWKVPTGATHFRLVHLLGVVSDIVYEPAVAGYLPAAPAVDGKSAVSWSDYIFCDPDSIASHRPAVDISFETTLPLTEVPENATVIEALGIEFYQQLGKVYEWLKQGRAGKVIGAF